MTTEYDTTKPGATVNETERQNPQILLLSDRTRFGQETGAGIMRNRCAFTSRDMAYDWPEAFTYAIVVGWQDDDDPEGDATGEIAAKFEWDDEMVAFLREAHERFQKLADRRVAS